MAIKTKLKAKYILFLIGLTCLLMVVIFEKPSIYLKIGGVVSIFSGLYLINNSIVSEESMESDKLKDPETSSK